MPTRGLATREPVSSNAGRVRPSIDIEYRMSAMLGYASVLACAVLLGKLLF